MITLIIIGILLFCTATYWTHASSYSQFFGRFPYRIKTKEKIIALTFDDGPNDPFTTELLDYLKSQNVKATFFLVGRCVERQPKTAQRIVKDGHTVGNHSLSHVFSNYLKNPPFKDEITKAQDIIHRTTGKKPALFRPPWLYRQPALLMTLKQLGMQPVSGTFCHPFEVAQISSHRIAKTAIRHSKPGAILIFHDGQDGQGGNRAQTIDAVKLTVETLKQRGYSFVTVDKLLGIKPYL